MTTQPTSDLKPIDKAYGFINVWTLFYCTCFGILVHVGAVLAVVYWVVLKVIGE